MAGSVGGGNHHLSSIYFAVQDSWLEYFRHSLLVAVQKKGKRRAASVGPH